MQSVAVGFWGAFFGCACLAVLAAVLAFARVAPRIALTGSLAASVSAAYALVFLGWVPVGSDALERLRAVTAMGSAAVLGMLLLVLLGAPRRDGPAAWARRAHTLVSLVGLSAAAALPAGWALPIALVAAAVVAVGALVVSAFAARRGERAGWLTLAALPFVMVGMSGLDWYALYPDRTPWQLHALSATAGVGYLLCIAVAMWTRYSYLLEVRRVLEHGQNFDPVSWMPAYESGMPPGALLGRLQARGCSILVVSVSNLQMVEELHGRAAYNHAVFVCASRLRRLALPGVTLVRMREDGFLLVSRNLRDPQQLVDQARRVRRRLCRPVTLGTHRDIRQLDEGGAIWEPRIGIGVLYESADVPVEVAIAGARAVSRTAWGFDSQMAWYDEAADTVAELPVSE